MSGNSAAPLQASNAQPAASNPPVVLQKKGLLGAANRGPVGKSIVSPTDNVLSPCSAKLSGAKQRHFQKGKPSHFASTLSQLAASDSNSSIGSTGEKGKVDF